MEEYRLYPIPKADVDWPLYLLVKHFLSVNYGLGLDDDTDEPFAGAFKRFDGEGPLYDTKYSLRIVFPSVELTVNYSEAMLEQEVLVLKLYFPVEQFEQSYPGQTEPFDDDDVWYENVPMEYYCFAAGGPDIELKHYKTQLPSQWPKIYYNEDAFSDALSGLVGFLQRNRLTETPWLERLKTAKRMLEVEANELHILHNAGLYDHNSLWKWLTERGLPADDIQKARDAYVSQLKIYAMFALNELNWRWGTPVDKGERENGLYLFEQKVCTAEEIQKEKNEQEQRLKTERAKARRQQKEESPKLQDTTAERKEEMDELHKAAAQWEPKLHKARYRKQKPSNKDSGDKYLAILLLILIVALLVTNFYFGTLINHKYPVLRTLVIAIGNILAYVAVSKATSSIKFRHPLKFRYLLVAVGIVAPFLFGWIGNRITKALIYTVTPGALMLEVLVIMTIVIAAATIIRRKLTDERRARPYTLAILIAVMAVVGFFFGGFIMNL